MVMQKISLDLENELYLNLKHLAVDRESTMSELIREAIINTYKSDAKKETQMHSSYSD